MTLTPRDRLITGLLLALPLLVFHWLLPVVSGLTIGNDYVAYPISQQLELQYGLAHGWFPLFCAGFLEGHSCSALTLGQLFHPLPYLARLWPGYWAGDALTASTFVRLLELGVAQVALFRLMRQLRAGAVTAFVASFVAVYNLRTLDMFRYGAALESAVGFTLLGAALGFHWLDRASIPRRLLIVGATWLLATGGHPQITYLGLLSAALLGLLFPHVAAALRGDPDVPPREHLRYLASSGLLVLAGLLLAAPFLLPFYREFVQANASRVGQPYEWSAAYSDTWGGALGSLFRPLSADVHGAFGGSSLLAVLAVLPFLLVGARRARGMAWLFGGALLLFLASLGTATPLHRGFWSLVPLASSFRVPGRLTLALPLLAGLALVWVMRDDPDEPPKGWRRPTILAAALGTLLIVAFRAWGARLAPLPGPFTPAAIGSLPAWADPAVFWLGLLSLWAMAARSLAPSRVISIGAASLLSVLVVAQSAISLRFGTWVVPRTPTPTLAQMDELRRDLLGFTGAQGLGLESGAVRRQTGRSVLDPWLARISRSWTSVPTLDAAYGAILERDRPDLLVVEDPSRASSPAAPALHGTDRVRLAFTGFNRFDLQVALRSEGYLTLSFPWFEEFRAQVDGATAPVLRANGYQVAIPVPAGDHLVRLTWVSSASTLGWLIAAFTALGLLGWGSRGWPSRRRVGAIAGALVLILVVGVSLRGRMRGGDDLGTRYAWSSDELPPGGNLAYGKPTSMSSRRGEEANLFYGGRGVDGSYAAPPFSTGPGDPSPWWQVDLGRVRPLGTIRVHGAAGALGTPAAPIALLTSTDGVAFSPIQVLSTRPYGAQGPIEAALAGTARYVRLAVLGRAPLSATEVELLPP